MKIAFNARVLTERQGGPYRYTRNVLRELAKIDRVNEYFLVLNDDYSFDFPLPANFHTVFYRTKSKLLFDYWYMPYFSWTNPMDVLVFPKNTFSPMVRGKKVPVFHDIIYFEKELGIREFNFFDNLHHKIMIPISARFAAVNLVVSDFTASRMRSLLGIRPETIRVIKEGVEDSFRVIKDRKLLDAVKLKYGLSAPFFFYSGSLSPRKNMLRVIQAFYAVKDRIPHNLYYTGGYSWRDNDVLKYIEDHGLDGRVIKLGFLSEEELVAMYNLADCYLYPSLYEGFGLPILEAQACGCPVITSTAASCPEVAGDSALIVEPHDVGAISEAMIEISRNKKLRTAVVKKGFANCRRFSWEECARELAGMFEKVRVNG